MTSALLAIGWQPFLRGILVTGIMVGVLCGSTYLILATNLGGRLGFLVTLSALAGWIFIMGAIWWSYGQGLKGSEPSWKPVSGKTVLSDPRVLYEAGLIQSPLEESNDPAVYANAASQALQDGGWNKLDPALPSFQQAGSSAAVFIEESGAFDAGEFQVVNVYDRGGAASPKLGPIDFFAFRHEPYYALVEVAPLVPQYTEPGRAPARPIIDTTRDHQYVFMKRDLGQKRVPSAIVCLSGLVVFLITVWLLHRRDRYVTANRAVKALPAKA